MEYGIYIHIPFCIVKCIYCDFYSITDRDGDIPVFVDAICSEINSSATRFEDPGKVKVRTIFIGGGTPSLVEPKWIERILDLLASIYDMSSVSEVTIEANPGEAPLQRLKDFRSIGINRISMGFQSFQPELLKFLSRIHSVDDCFKTFRHARQAGFENINTDMIYNIPGQSNRIWKNDLERLIELEPDHISAYSLTVEKNTMLHSMVKTNKVKMPSEELDIEFFQTTNDVLSNAGFPRYEISNFAKSGYECGHNQGYWRMIPYLGFGPSAHSYDGFKRWWNTASLDQYLQLASQNESPISGSEILSDNNKFNELIFNGLRMTEGAAIKELERHYQGLFRSYLEQAMIKWPQLLYKDGYLKLSEKGVLLADEISADLFVLP
ncbi:MAG: radical SAM family heme chaperone HemW [Candidatus Marinimicrobia bacterium]|jgi:oxygen-independent coproporphyrinogen III oxidase|nr:radical SAM family heme chaperone HemW [Candidatus Neomarinimicrobiota bacterium]MBT3634254.1 radical SAM family heme chaperone HemW [Candidatus Neomarinimicrobiota bacterium]MBT3682947.1 radical SAM family heme chaperone HemW [Candidatus Neomarinimicrobiota bacterium]MBT3760063.1 radical SAM family heme chaperone HemW [Candidatus Neomarinimicrobiota bacterium]MBT3896170.1 radical SAM family heme chaperone HemW [Candidatus Neomarinimicrobiota bacterium]